MVGDVKVGDVNERRHQCSDRLGLLLQGTDDRGVSYDSETVYFVEYEYEVGVLTMDSTVPTQNRTRKEPSRPDTTQSISEPLTTFNCALPDY